MVPISEASGMCPDNMLANKVITVKDAVFVMLFLSKPWMRKVRMSSRHLLAEIRAIHGTWYTSNFF